MVFVTCKGCPKNGTVRYDRHKPEQILRCQIIEKYDPQSLTCIGQQDKNLPKCVRSEFKA